MEHLLHFWPIYTFVFTIIFGTAGFLIKVYWVDIKGQKARSDLIEKDLAETKEHHKEEIEKLSDSLKENFDNDTEAKEEVHKDLQEVKDGLKDLKNSFDKLVSYFKILAKNKGNLDMSDLDI